MRRLAAGLLLSRTGDQLTTIALLWFVLDRAVSAAAVPLGAAGGGLLLDHVLSTTVIGASAVTCMLAGAAALCVPALHRLPARARRAAAQGG